MSFKTKRKAIANFTYDFTLNYLGWEWSAPHFDLAFFRHRYTHMYERNTSRAALHIHRPEYRRRRPLHMNTRTLTHT